MTTPRQLSFIRAMTAGGRIETSNRRKLPGSQAIWEVHDPPQNKCCICGGSLEGLQPNQIIVEPRPTGVGRKIQQWPYHKGCFVPRRQNHVS